MDGKHEKAQLQINTSVIAMEDFERLCASYFKHNGILIIGGPDYMDEVHRLSEFIVVAKKNDDEQ